MMNLEKLTQEYYINELINNGVEYNDALIIMKDFAKKSIRIREHFERFKSNDSIMTILYALSLVGQDLVHGVHLKSYLKLNECDLFHVGS